MSLFHLPAPTGFYKVEGKQGAMKEPTQTWENMLISFFIRLLNSHLVAKMSIIYSLFEPLLACNQRQKSWSSKRKKKRQAIRQTPDSYLMYIIIVESCRTIQHCIESTNKQSIQYIVDMYTRWIQSGKPQKSLPSSQLPCTAKPYSQTLSLYRGHHGISGDLLLFRWRISYSTDIINVL